LTENERRVLEVLESALEVSEYTDNVDVVYSHTHVPKHRRMLESLSDMLSISSGLMVANNFSKGGSLVQGKSLDDNLPFFADMFEIGRRYKIMNPTKMRDTYGKMMFILMDAERLETRVPLNLVKPLQTVHSFLAKKGVLTLLSDPLLEEATASIDNDSGKSREVFY